MDIQLEQRSYAAWKEIALLNATWPRYHVEGQERSSMVVYTGGKGMVFWCQVDVKSADLADWETNFEAGSTAVSGGDIAIGNLAGKGMVFQSKYADVAAYSSINHDYTPANGQVIGVCRFSGASAYLDDTAVSLIWDPGGAEEELLAATHGDCDVEVCKQITGDGAKVLRIQIVNDTAAAHTMGGQWEGRLM